MVGVGAESQKFQATVREKDTFTCQSRRTPDGKHRAHMNSSNSSSSRLYQELTLARASTFDVVAQYQTIFLSVIVTLSLLIYKWCLTCKTDAANPLPILPLRKRTASQHQKNIEMTSYPTLRNCNNDGVLLSKASLKLLQNTLPLHLQLSDWSLLYASNRDGYNLETFLRLAEDEGPTILVVADTAGHVFGGFNSISWERPKSKAGHYFGTGESYVFTVLPAFKHYPWTGLNSEFVMTKSNCIAFGGGGKFAFTLDEKFQRGSSDASQTYNNQCLANSYTYDVVSVELWKFERFR